MHFPHYAQFVDYSNLFYQVVLLADDVRCNTYEEAIKAIVSENDIVVDLGCGSGIMGRFALKYGAKKVIAIDNHKEMIELAKFINSQLYPNAQIEYIIGDATNIILDTKVDVMISEFIGGLGDDEGFTSIVSPFSKNNLKNSGIACPKEVNLFAQFAIWKKDKKIPLPGFLANDDITLKSTYFYESNINNIEILGSPKKIHKIDGLGLSNNLEHWYLDQGNISSANSIVVWFEAILSENVMLTNKPGSTPTTWGYAIIPLPQKYIDSKKLLKFTLIRDGYLSHIKISD